MSDKYAVGYGERFYEPEFDTREAAIEHARRNDFTHIGRAVFPTVDSLMNSWFAESISEMLGEAAYEAAGEACEGWPCLSQEQSKELENLIMKFYEEHNPPDFFIVYDIEEVIAVAKEGDNVCSS